MSTLKYGNKPVWLSTATGETFSEILFTAKEWKRMGNMYFASKLEYDVYIGLKAFGGKYRIKTHIQHQHYCELVSNTTKCVSWNIDFKITFNGDPSDYLLVEAKGVELPEFKVRRDLLEILHSSDFERLIIIKDASKLHHAMIEKISKQK